MYILRQNGKFISQHDNDGLAIQALLMIQPKSIENAFSHAGYSVTKEKVVSLNCETQEFGDPR